MQNKTQYQMRVRKDLTAKYQDLPLGIWLSYRNPFVYSEPTKYRSSTGTDERP